MTLARPAAQVLGISHLVYSVAEFEPVQCFLSELGYRVKSEQLDGPNPLEKMPFVDGDLSPRYQMKLWVCDRGGPAIELLKEPHSGTPVADPVFEILLSESSTPSWDWNRFSRSIQEAPLHLGFRCLDGGRKSLAGILLHCPELDAAMSFWKRIGIEVECKASGVALAKVPRLLGKGAFPVVLLEDRERKYKPVVLNQAGMTCLSFFRTEVDSLARSFQESSMELGLEVGQCFDLAPFGRKIRIFFMRKDQTTIYEFLSVC